MNEEARNTDKRNHGWGLAPLRGQAISFVSAGRLKREEDAWNTMSEGESPQKQSDAEQTPSKPAMQATHSKELIEEPVAEYRPPEPQYSAPETATNADDAIAAENFQAAPASTANGHNPSRSMPAVQMSASPSSDSEEEIVFAGRSGKSQHPSRRPTPAIPVANVASQVSTDGNHVNKDKPSSLPSVLATSKEIHVTEAAREIQAQNDATLQDKDPFDIPKKESKELPFHPSLFSSKKQLEDQLMQDYLDNMALDDSDEIDDTEAEAPNSSRKKFKKTETFRMFKGDGLENAKVQTKSNGVRRPVKDALAEAIDWNSDDLADFDDLNTTDEEVEDIGQVIRYRERRGTAQYLVVAEGAEASDAKWMLHTKLVSESAMREIQIYEEIRQMNIEEGSYDEDEDSDDDDEDEDDEDELQDLIDNIESEDDENARIMQYTSRMSDEQIARALAKQEELGLGSDELMLFDGEAAEEEPAIDDVFGAGDDFIPFSMSKHTSNRGRSKRNKKQRDSFPSAEAFADAIDQDPYGAFDIMDFDRPSLKPKKKGRKSDFPWDLSDLDEELKDQLVNTWTKDREKKAERKRQKEEARLTATLDAQDNGDPAIIKARIRQFLVQDVDVLKLSPMESNVRAAVHRLAKSLKLNSRSEGKDGIGIGRYPVLTKTPKTPYYSAETIWQIDALMNIRKFFPKNLYGSHKKGPKVSGVARPRRGGGGGGGVMAGVSYRDGEEVGASAPEIGSDNKGRALLEKMGWKAGMGIGAEGNKGSLDHVRHIVKTTKAGLG